MLLILVAMAVWLPAMVGLGLPLANVLRKAGGGVVISIAIRIAIAGLLGMFIASILAALTNFFWPVYPVVSSTLCLTGWILFLLHRRIWRRLPRRAWRWVIAIALVVAAFDARGIPIYDTGLYHLQAVRWMTHGPLPRGLVNLHTRLGFNCAWFSAAAATETPLLLGKSCFILNALLAVLMALPAVDQLLRLRRQPIRADQILIALLLLPLGQLGIRLMMISSLSPDPVIALLIIFSIALWVRSTRFTPLIFVFACFAVTTKLAALPLLILATIAWIVWMRRGIRNKTAHAIAMAVCIFAAANSVAHGIWLSGYLAYPSPIGRFAAFRWTALPAHTLEAAREIECWSKYGKIFADVRRGDPWMILWLLKNLYAPELWIFCVLLMTGAVLLIVRRPRICARPALALSALIPAIVFWFSHAPAIRFGYGYLFAFAGLIVAIGCTGYVRGLNPFSWRITMYLSILAFLLFTRIDRKILKTSLVNWPAIPVTKLQLRHTRDGTAVWSPVNDDRIWDESLMATPEFNPDLKIERDSQNRVREFWMKSED